MSEQTIAILGMPAAGKSTFLAATYHALNDGVPDLAAMLTRQPTNRVYLERLRDAWLQGQALPRTQRENGELIELDLLISTADVRLTVPDIAGETIEDLFASRDTYESLLHLVQAADGVLLFTHPDHLRPRLMIADAQRALTQVGEIQAHAPKPFDPALVPGEVQLVDLLQWVLNIRDSSTRVAIMISAWDKCLSQNPTEWITVQMPMLTAFLNGRQDTMPFTVFGISAQGGDYSMHSEIADKRSGDRAYIVLDDGSRSADLTLPLKWCAGHGGG